MAALLSSSCVSSHSPENITHPGGNGSGLDHGMIELGEQLEDPYSVENISKAISSLYPSRAGRVVPEPTDLYVRFLPENDSQLQMLVSENITLLDHPMDYRIVREGDYYRDPSLAEGSITWQYSVVSRDFAFPRGIRYEILDKVYIAENDPASKADGIDWDAVERESYRLTGNEDMLLPLSKAESSSKPSGDIRIIDKDLGDTPVGVKGVMVCCNSFVKFGTGYTDEQGHYELNRGFPSEVRYRIVYKNKSGFAIGFNLILVPGSVSTLGKAGPEGVSVTIDQNSERSLFCRSVINNACSDYYDSCREDSSDPIDTPPVNLRIWCFQSLDSSCAAMFQHGCMINNTIVGQWLGEYAQLLRMFLPDLTIGLKDKSSYKSIYSVVVHECAHASHFMKAGLEFWDPYTEFILKSFVAGGGKIYGSRTDEGSGYCDVGEMWAYFVQADIVNARYGGSEVFGTQYWFRPQILGYLAERGITRFKIFKALDAGVVDRATLCDRLIYYYPEFKSMINQAFQRYE